MKSRYCSDARIARIFQKIFETFEKFSFLFKFKSKIPDPDPGEGENFNHRNTLSILRIKI